MLDWPLSSPITGIGRCCARAASGHPAAAPPRSVMNSRRRMSCPQTRPAIYHITGRSGRCASQRNLPAYVGSGSRLCGNALIW